MLLDLAILPQVVFNQKGEREASLSKAAHEMEDSFGKLMEQLVNTAVLKSPRWAGILPQILECPWKPLAHIGSRSACDLSADATCVPCHMGTFVTQE